MEKKSVRWKQIQIVACCDHFSSLVCQYQLDNYYA